MVETNSATRDTSACSSEFRFACAPVSTSCSRMLPSRSRSNSATVSVRSILLVSCISVTAATETCRDWSIALRLVSSMSFSDLLIAPVATSLAVLIMRAMSAELLVIDWAKMKPLPSIAFSASSVVRPMSAVSWPALGADRLDQRTALVVDHLRQLLGVALHRADDLLGLAGERHAEHVRRRRHAAFRLRRYRLDLRADLVRGRHQGALRRAGAGLQRLHGVAGDLGEGALQFGRGRAQLAAGAGRVGHHRRVGVDHAVAQLVGGVGGESHERLLEVASRRCAP